MNLRLPQTPQRFVLLVAGYFALQVCLRLFLGPDQLEIDEAEQLLLAQRVQPGYSGQPPLYTWIQIVFFTVFGYNVLALALVKNLLLFGLYVSSYFVARRLSLPPALAAAAALSMLLLPQIGWESQRDLTHSVLVTGMASMTLWLALTMLERKPGCRHYLLLGLLIGAGILSKWNYAFFLLALLLALLSLRPRLVLHPGFALSVCVAAILFSPYGLWILDATDFATASLKKLDDAAVQAGALGNLAWGVLDLLKAVLQFSLLFIVVYRMAVGTWPTGWSSHTGRDRPEGVVLLVRLLVSSLLVIMAFLLLSGASAFKDRWLLPLLFYLPALFFALTPASAIDARALRRTTVAVLAAMLLVPAGLAGRVYLGPYFGKFTKPHFPAAELAEKLGEQLEGRSVIVAHEVLLAGNLKLHLPQHFVTYSSVDFALPDNDGIILTWEARKGEAPHSRIREYLQRELPDGHLDRDFKGRIEAPLRLSEDRTYTLRYQRYLQGR